MSGRLRAPLPCALALVAGVACVPATDSKDAPRGAAGASFAASEEGAVRPFVTSDGWTVTIDTLAILADVTAQGPDVGGVVRLLWDAKKPAQTYLPALLVGDCVVVVRLGGFYLEGGWFDAELERLVSTTNVDPTTARRFRSPPDNRMSRIASSERGELRTGPAIVVSARGEKNGQTVRFDLALANDYYAEYTTDFRQSAAVQVVPNAVRYASFVTDARLLFHDPVSGRVDFEPFANADRLGDRDGVASAAELDAVRAHPDEAVDCEAPLEIGPITEGSRGAGTCWSLLDLLVANGAGLFVPAPRAP